VVIAEEPKLVPFREAMKKNIARVLGANLDEINLKATTEEGLGFTGKKEGIELVNILKLIGRIEALKRIKSFI